MSTTIKSLYDIDKEIWNKVIAIFIKKMEDTLSALLITLKKKNLNHLVAKYSEKQKTVEKTKFLSLFYEEVLMESLQELGLSVEKSTEDGSDVIFNPIDSEKEIWEVKLTLSLNDDAGWTGNAFSRVKVHKHILIKLNFDDNNRVTGIFFGLFDLKDAQSGWTHHTEKGNAAFSVLKVLKEDVSHLKVVKGDIKLKQKYVATIMA